MIDGIGRSTLHSGTKFNTNLLTHTDMYLVINKTKKTTTKVLGSWPDLDNDLNNGDLIIVISLYSNTIKVPSCTVLNGINEWDWEDYPLPFDRLIAYANI